MSPRSRALARRTLSGSLKLVAFLFVFVYFGLPAITNARDALDRLTTVEPALLLLGLGLGLTALVTYSQLTRTALPAEDAIGLATLTRIQVTTRAVTNVVPGGSAAGAAIGYRMLTLSGQRGTDAGFALVAAALGSAVVLNALLWVALVVSIPAAGFRPVYVTMALLGVLVMAAFAGLVLGLARGERYADRAARRLAARVWFLDGEALARVVQRLASRLREILADPPLVRRLAGWATLNWLLDAAALWVFLAAFGAATRPDALLVAFCVANMSAVIPVTPGGLGVLDATLVAMLALFGYPEAAGLAVPTYRLAQYWLPIPLGAVFYVTLRRGPWRVDREHRLRPLRDETEEVVRSGETVYEWAERHGWRTRHGAPPAPPSGPPLAPPDAEP